ncbi:MAG TPA: MBOAT family O-acyltransferase [Paludibacteraceae bacterium]|nr:MBOAT family O-acyltransferase [Paludibacteraceae bacterium]HPT43109.1 MBOAT family O-acyltransferase [Paludibacteraceae bacterium]
MLFNSFDFAVFMPIVFLLYWLVFNRTVTLRNSFLLVASYAFYSFWDWRFLFLLLFSSLADFILGLQLHKTSDDQPRKRKMWLYCSLAINFGILGFFKYYNFFTESFVEAFTIFGRELNYEPLKIILPVGVSFYTFQSLTYIIGIYKRKVEPTNRIIDFLAYVSFFPQLVAGPIERAAHFLPQFHAPKVFSYKNCQTGLLLIAFGLFKKIVIADRLAVYVNGVYGDIPSAGGISILVAVLFFAFQLYFDFSAYSDIAIGSARLLGFELMTNFRRPYLSKSFSEFWTRWHISLSSWFRDYVYFPLGGSRRGTRRTMINVMIVFLLSGLWHGASWNFVIWGGVNGLFLIIFDRIFKLEQPGNIKKYLAPAFIFCSWAVSLIFFRAQTFADAISVFTHAGFAGSDLIYNFGLKAPELKFAFFMLAASMLYELLAEKKGEKLAVWFYNKPVIVRWSLYLAIVFSIIYLGSYGSSNDNTFIYFQF